MQTETKIETKDTEKAGVQKFDTKANPIYFVAGDGMQNKTFPARFKVMKNGKFTSHMLEVEFHQNYLKRFRITESLKQFLIANGGTAKTYKGHFREGVGKDDGRPWLGFEVNFKDNFRDMFFFEWADLHTLEIYKLVKPVQVKS